MLLRQDLQSASHFLRIVDLILPIAVSAVLGFIAWLIVRMINGIERKHTDDHAGLSERVHSLHKELDEHKSDCDRIPKALIMSRLDYLEKMWQQGHLDAMTRIAFMEKQIASNRAELAAIHANLRMKRNLEDDKD